LAGTLKPTAEMLSNSRVHMDSARASDAQVLDTIKTVYEASGYVLDPHSAVGVAAARELGSTPGVPMVCLACAHWAKFPDALTQALGEKAMGGLTVPEPLASLHTLPTRVKPLPNALPKVQAFIEETCVARSKA
jgi:threonine synthase